MHPIRASLVAAATAFILSLPAAAAAATAEPIKPLRFFEGRTEGSGTIKLFMKKPYRSRSLGRGVIDPDGTLVLVQQVQDDGKPPRVRRWRIHQVGPGHYSGTMSEAAGPVTIDDVGGNYRFRFTMKGNFAVEQWLFPLPGGMAARNSMKVRRFGMTVGTSDGTIRKIVGS